MEPSPPIQPPPPPPSEPVTPPHPPPASEEGERNDSHVPSELSAVSSTSTTPTSTSSRGGGSGGGRSSTSGRSLVSTGRLRDGRGGRGTHHHQHASTYGHHPAQQRTVPVTIHASSGVPFGHVPSYLPGSSSLVEELDRRVLLVLRDGKHLIGVR
jgi:hypothetical protein